MFKNSFQKTNNRSLNNDQLERYDDQLERDLVVNLDSTESPEEKKDMLRLNNLLKSLLIVSINRPKPPGIELLESHIKENKDVLGSFRVDNATDLLKLLWPLSDGDITDFILESVKGKDDKVANKLFNSYAVTMTTVTKTDRQAWALGAYFDYKNDPESFKSMASLPMNFISENFESFSEKGKFNLLDFTNGLNHTKGPQHAYYDFLNASKDTFELGSEEKEDSAGTLKEITGLEITKSYLKDSYDGITHDDFSSFETSIENNKKPIIIDTSLNNWEIQSIKGDKFILKKR